MFAEPPRDSLKNLTNIEDVRRANEVRQEPKRTFPTRTDHSANVFLENWNAHLPNVRRTFAEHMANGAFQVSNKAFTECLADAFLETPVTNPYVSGT